MSQDTTILLGLNASSSYEAAELRKHGNKIIYIGPGKQDQITLNKITYDLHTKKDIESFSGSLDLSMSKTQGIANTIHSTGANIRDELAQLALEFSKLEKNGSTVNRLIISGHSVGNNQFWGDDNGILTFADLKALTKAMPTAAGKLEDIHLSACSSGDSRELKRLRSIFPNLTTIWAYDTSAPGSYSGATTHLSRWDKATRGSTLELNRIIAAKTRKGDNVVVWSKNGGYQSKVSSALRDLLRRIQAAEPTFQAYFLGDRTVSNTQTGPLRDYYNDL